MPHVPRCVPPDLVGPSLSAKVLRCLFCLFACSLLGLLSSGNRSWMRVVSLVTEAFVSSWRRSCRLFATLCAMAGANGEAIVLGRGTRFQTCYQGDLLPPARSRLAALQRERFGAAGGACLSRCCLSGELRASQSCSRVCSLVRVADAEVFVIVRPCYRTRFFRQT